jgi:hypothetical protein
MRLRVNSGASADDMTKRAFLVMVASTTTIGAVVTVLGVTVLGPARLTAWIEGLAFAQLLAWVFAGSGMVSVLGALVFLVPRVRQYVEDPPSAA